MISIRCFSPSEILMCRCSILTVPVPKSTNNTGYPSRSSKDIKSKQRQTHKYFIIGPHIFILSYHGTLILSFKKGISGDRGEIIISRFGKTIQYGKESTEGKRRVTVTLVSICWNIDANSNTLSNIL